MPIGNEFKNAAIPLDEFPEMRRWHDQLNAFEPWRNPFPVRLATSAVDAALNA
ncbi:hypothetical protein [Paraburkholderia sp.]|jgi:glutathione S-transferase|uniref:hypothetical protein n=1 Tax=Paraburkholderia sp. TaxID=1926495 RepID=UPI003C7D30F4